MAIRFADAQGYQPVWRATRESCEATLFAGLATARGIAVTDVVSARSQLDRRGFDWLVNLPIATLCLLIAFVMTRRIGDRFRDELVPTVVTVVLASVVLAAVVVVVGQVWAGSVESIRVSSPSELSRRPYPVGPPSPTDLRVRGHCGLVRCHRPACPPHLST
jgi:hypothetical protein